MAKGQFFLSRRARIVCGGVEKKLLRQIPPAPPRFSCHAIVPASREAEALAFAGTIATVQHFFALALEISKNDRGGRSCCHVIKEQLDRWFYHSLEVADRTIIIVPST